MIAEVIKSLVSLLTRYLQQPQSLSERGAFSQTPAAYFATTLRNQATLHHFLQSAAASGLIVNDISLQAKEGTVRFQHHLGLDPQRSNIFLHHISCVSFTGAASSSAGEKGDLHFAP